MKFPKKKTNLAYQRIGDHTLILDTRSNKAVHRLNGVASLLWELCDGAHSQDSMVKLLYKEYEVTEQKAQEDVQKFIKDLEQASLLEG